MGERIGKVKGEATDKLPEYFIAKEWRIIMYPIFNIIEITIKTVIILTHFILCLVISYIILSPIQYMKKVRLLDLTVM